MSIKAVVDRFILSLSASPEYSFDLLHVNGGLGFAQLHFHSLPHSVHRLGQRVSPCGGDRILRRHWWSKYILCRVEGQWGDLEWSVRLIWGDSSSRGVERDDYRPRWSIRLTMNHVIRVSLWSVGWVERGFTRWWISSTFINSFHVHSHLFDCYTYQFCIGLRKH